MSYKDAVHHAHLVLSLCSKASRYVRDLLDAPDVSLYSIVYSMYACICRDVSYIHTYFCLSYSYIE